MLIINMDPGRSIELREYFVVMEVICSTLFGIIP